MCEDAKWCDEIAYQYYNTNTSKPSDSENTAIFPPNMIDLVRMATCDTLVLSAAASTFAFWGGFLGNNQKKVSYV